MAGAGLKGVIIKHVMAADKAVPSELHGRQLAVCRWVASHASPQARLLDVGCGYGWLESYVLANCPGTQMVGVELTDDDLRIFRERLDDARVASVVGSAMELPVDSQSVDLYVSTEVIEHIPKGQELRMMREVARVLKPGGRGLITTPAATHRSQLSDPAWWLLGHRHYQPDQLRQWAAAAGLRVTDASLRGGWSELVALYDLYLNKWIARRPPALDSRLAPRLDREWSGGGRPFMGVWLEVAVA